MKSTTTRVVAGLLLCGTITVGARAYYVSQADDDPNVTTGQVSRGSLIDQVSATGTLQAVTTVQVGTQISGIVSWLGADFNSLVHKGEVIAKIEPSLLESQVTQMRAGLARATADAESVAAQAAAARQKFDRTEDLHTKGIVAQADLDAATLALSLANAQVSSAGSQIVQARASLSQAEVALARTVISAPIDGIVIQRSVDVGQAVSASVSSPTVFAIAADLTRMQVNAKIDESDIGKIKPAQPVMFQVDAFPGRSFTGTVLQVRLEPTLLQNVTTYSVIIAAPNPDLALKPGMTASVNIELARRDDVLRVPNAALRFKPSAAMYALLGQTPPAVGSPRATGTTGATGATGAAGATGATGAVIPATVAVRRVDPSAATSDEGRVWLHVNNQLKPVRVRLGLTDGQTTELVEGDLQPGTALVTNVAAAGADVRAAATSTGGLFMPTTGGRGAGGAGGRSATTGR